MNVSGLSQARLLCLRHVESHGLRLPLCLLFFGSDVLSGVTVSGLLPVPQFI